jgi:hypothetical protein
MNESVTWLPIDGKSEYFWDADRDGLKTIIEQNRTFANSVAQINASIQSVLKSQLINLFYSEIEWSIHAFYK